MGDFVDPQQILGARTSFCGMQTSLTTAPLTGFEDVGSTKQKRGHHLARAGFLSSRSHGTAGFILQIKTAIAHAVAVFRLWEILQERIKGGIASGRKKGRPFHRSPLWIPSWVRGGPRNPRNEVYLNGMIEKTRHAANAHCGARGQDEIGRQPKVYLSPTKFNVHFRYLKTKPLLLPNIKKCRHRRHH